jgi:hypothetical protein
MPARLSGLRAGGLIKRPLGFQAGGMKMRISRSPFLGVDLIVVVVLPEKE